MGSAAQVADALIAFAPTVAAARARIDAVDPEAYARTRNALEGAATRLSPYLTHGLIEVPEVLARVRRRHRVEPTHSLAFELGWREFFHHVWRHLGEGILQDRRPPIWSGAYAQTLPADLLEARTGVPVVDQAVRTLYADGWLHNHARLWLASYVVHLRKVHWRIGADWMYGYLLDGDLASNHLSWQWVAGTFSTKPYLFDAANVQRHAPAPWHSPGTVIDQPRAVLETLARSAPDVGPERRAPHEGVVPPVCIAMPPASLLDGFPLGSLSQWLEAVAATASDTAAAVPVIHPWDLGERRTPGLGLIDPALGHRFPWSVQRWRFVLQALRPQIARLYLGEAREALQALQTTGRPVQVRATLMPGWREALDEAAVRGVQITPVPREHADPETLQPSFTRFWKTIVPQP